MSVFALSFCQQEVDSKNQQLENAISASNTQTEMIVSLQTQLGERSGEVGTLLNELASLKASQHVSTVVVCLVLSAC